MENFRAAIAGMTADEIRELIETSVHAGEARDAAMLADYLAGPPASDAPSSGGG